MIKVIGALIVSLPEIIKLLDKLITKVEIEIKKAEEQAKAEKRNKRVKDELQKITEAFKKRNSTMLNDSFNRNSDVELRIESESSLEDGGKAKH